MSDEKALLDRVLEVLKQAGVEGDVYLEHRRTLQLSVREGRLEDVSRAEVRGLAIRAMREGRLGFVHTSAAEADQVVEAARKACDLARAGSVRDDLLLADAAGSGDGKDEGESLGLYDSSIETQPIGEKEERARAAEKAALGFDPRVRRCMRSGFEENLVGRWLANTRGLFRHSRRSGLQVSLEVAAEDQGEMQPGWAEHQAIRGADLPDPAVLGRKAAEHSVRLLGGRPVATGRFPVVFAPETGFALLVYIETALRGDHLSRGRSWLAERDGAKIGSPLVTIRDDGRRPGGLGTAPFDGEGVDTREQILLEQGTIKGKLLDLASGKRLGLPSTGNSTRGGYETLPEIGSRNLYLEPGTRSPEEIVSGVERGLWVWGLSGWWIGLNPSNPQFSSAASGLWIEKGKPAQPVARVTVAGSLEEILTGIEEVGNDLVWDHAVKTPTFRVRELSVSGT